MKYIGLKKCNEIEFNIIADINAYNFTINEIDGNFNCYFLKSYFSKIESIYVLSYTELINLNLLEKN